MRAISYRSNPEQSYNKPGGIRHSFFPTILHSGAVTRIYCLPSVLTSSQEVVVTWHSNGTTKGKQFSSKIHLFVVPFIVRRLTMEELKRLYSSRRGYRAHLKKLLAKANEITETHRNTETECDVTAIADLRDQLQRNDDIISKLDSQIVALIQDEEELEANVCEAEEINASLSTSITQLTQILDAHKTRKVTEHIPPKVPPMN